MLEKTCLNCKEKLNNRGYAPFILNHSFKCNHCQFDLYFSYSLWTQRLVAIGLVFSVITFLILITINALAALVFITFLFALSLFFYSITDIVTGTKEEHVISPKVHFGEIVLLVIILIMIIFKYRDGLLNKIYGPTIIIAQSTPPKMGILTNKNLVLFPPKHSIS